jgi:hypothetical protein
MSHQPRLNGVTLNLISFSYVFAGISVIPSVVHHTDFDATFSTSLRRTLLM